MDTGPKEARPRAEYQGNRGRSLSTAAEALGLSLSTLERQIRDGTVRSVKISTRRRVITDAEIARILAGEAA
jgi:excisionase family DNA binding protein